MQMLERKCDTVYVPNTPFRVFRFFLGGGGRNKLSGFMPCHYVLDERWTGYDTFHFPSLLYAVCRRVSKVTVPSPMSGGSK